MREINQKKGQIRVCPDDGETLEVVGIVGNEGGNPWTVWMICPLCEGEFTEKADLN